MRSPGAIISSSGDKGGDACQSIFLKEPNEIDNRIGNILFTNDNNTYGQEGKLSCPKCHTKIGHYHWYGAQCSCGTWIDAPAIQIPKTKIDTMLVLTTNTAPTAIFVQIS